MSMAMSTQEYPLDVIEVTKFGDKERQFIPTAMSTTLINQPKNVSPFGKQERATTRILKRYDIDYKEWKLYISQWA
jgi:hypothetical protein